jgi:hypothetical protein
MQGGQYALILLVSPPFLILLTTLTNDVKLAKLSLACNHVNTKIITFAGIVWIILLWAVLNISSDENMECIIKIIKYFNINIDWIREYCLIRIIYYTILILVSLYIDYALTNWVKLLSDRDCKTMAESEELFNSFGDAIQVETKLIAVDEDIKKCCCCTGISGKSCGDNIRTQLQSSAFADIVAKIALAALIGTKTIEDQSFYLIMAATSVFLLISSYNESYKVAKFAYYLNTISMYIMLVGNAIFITNFIIEATRDLDSEIMSQSDENKNNCEALGIIIELARYANLCYHIFKILLLSWNSWNLYSLNGTAFSFMKSIGNRDYERLDGLHYKNRNSDFPLNIIHSDQPGNNPPSYSIKDNKF